ncbi:hypothetical protein P303_10445 [Xylella fastidiosa MUL0034]|nr:hypothetical protein P303_10445 [Xylella fastidiosa MUL0034]
MIAVRVAAMVVLYALGFVVPYLASAVTVA